MNPKRKCRYKHCNWLQRATASNTRRQRQLAATQTVGQRVDSVQWDCWALDREQWNVLTCFSTRTVYSFAYGQKVQWPRSWRWHRLCAWHDSRAVTICGIGVFVALTKIIFRIFYLIIFYIIHFIFWVFIIIYYFTTFSYVYIGNMIHKNTKEWYVEQIEYALK